MPVGEVTEALLHMWDPIPGAEPGSAPSEFHASQINLILHFGLPTTEEEARERFETAIRFTQRHPSRIIVLCPSEESSEGTLMEGKLFSQCFIGNSRREMSCCEALILGYCMTESDFLGSQVSLWLETDLRAHLNPTRMAAIAAAAADLVANARCRCPGCGAPGFAADGIVPGLPCAWCGEPTPLALAVVRTCARCGARREDPRPDGRTHAEPGECPSCNP